MTVTNLPRSGTYTADGGWRFDWGDVSAPDPIVFGPPRYHPPPTSRDLEELSDGTFRELVPPEVDETMPAQMAEELARQRLMLAMAETERSLGDRLEERLHLARLQDQIMLNRRVGDGWRTPL